MNFKAGNIGLAVAVAGMALGVLLVGTDPSDTEKQLIFWPAFVAGVVAAGVVVHHDMRGARRSRR